MWKKGLVVYWLYFHRRGHRVTEVNMNKQPVMWKKGLVVYWHYFSRPRASCRRNEHESTTCVISEFPNTHESRAEVWSAKRNDVCTWMTHFHQSWYGLHCLCSVIARDEASPPTVEYSIKKERNRGCTRPYFGSRGFEVVRNLNKMSCPCERIFFECVGYLGWFFIIKWLRQRGWIHAHFYARARGHSNASLPTAITETQVDWYYFAARTSSNVCCPRMSRQLDGVYFSLDSGRRGTPLVCSLLPEGIMSPRWT